MNLMIFRRGGYKQQFMFLKIALAGMVVYAYWRHLLRSKFYNISWFTLHELNSHLFVCLLTFKRIQKAIEILIWSDEYFG